MTTKVADIPQMNLGFIKHLIRKQKATIHRPFVYKTKQTSYSPSVTLDTATIRSVNNIFEEKLCKHNSKHVMTTQTVETK